MFQKIKGAIFKDDIQISFQKACLNSHHDRMHLSKLHPLIIKLQNKEGKHLVLSALQKKLTSKNYICKLKALIACHHILKKTLDPQLIEMLQKNINFDQQSLINNKKLDKNIEQIKKYVETNIIVQFQKYLFKLCLDIDSYNFASNFCKNQKHDLLNLVNYGFKTINLIYNILRMKQVFNKMGRYYKDHLQIVSLLLAYLDDLTVYNTFIKLASNVLITSVKQNREQQAKHIYLFLNEAQKISDQFYQFYYNRYYFYIIKDLIFFPTFLNLSETSYNQVKDTVKKIDRKLIQIVRRSVNPQTTYTESSKSQKQYFQNNNFTFDVGFNHNIPNLESFCQ